MTKKRALGKGLSALLTDANSDHLLGKNTGQTGPFHQIALQEIEVNPYQPRTHFEPEPLYELAESIRIHGIITPITVRKLSDHQFQLISGERRFKASKIAGLKVVPCYVRVADDQQMLEMSLIENIQREDLNPIEIAVSYQRLLKECNLVQEQVGERVGKNRSTVTNYMRLLKLPPDIQIGLRDKIISMGHAKAILGLEHQDQQLTAFKKIQQEELNVRKTEELIRKMLHVETPTEDTQPPSENADFKEMKKLQSRLSSHFSTKINIHSNGKKGDIRIPFVSIEDLNRILDILKL